MPKISSEKKQKLKDLYLQLATPEEKDAVLKMDKLDAIASSVKGNKFPEERINSIENGLKDIDQKVKRLKNTDNTELTELLREISAKIGMIKLQERIDKDYSPAYKMMIDKLSDVDSGIKGWRFPQYAYTGLRNKSFSPVNPATDGIGIGDYDSFTLTQTATVDTYKFYTNGITGLLVSTLTINYVDSTKTVILNAART